MFSSTDNDENAGAINTSRISWFKSKASAQSLLNSDLGHTFSPYSKMMDPSTKTLPLTSVFLLHLVATTAELQWIGT